MSLPKRWNHCSIRSPLITQSRKMVASTISVAEVCTKFKIGQYIVEDEQKGKSRAAYGKQVLIHLSARLIEKHGEGWLQT